MLECEGSLEEARGGGEVKGYRAAVRRNGDDRGVRRPGEFQRMDISRGGPGEPRTKQESQGSRVTDVETFDISGGYRLQEHRVHLHAHIHTYSCLGARFIAHLGGRVFSSGTNALFLLLFSYFDLGQRHECDHNQENNTVICIVQL